MVIKKLNELNPGDEGILLSLSDEVDDDLRLHLLGMGFVKGSKIKVEKVAPLGDPIKFQVKGYSICLRKNEAKNIEVEC